MASVLPYQRLRFVVEDTGIGIPPERLGAVFQAFEQAGGRDRNAEGTGLGLAISQQIIAMMGGHIHVESTVGQGSRFWFELDVPLARDWECRASGDCAPLVVGYRGQPMTILAVDDHPENRLILINMLEPLGFTVEEAADGQEGYDKALSLNPDLIITDVVMPHLSGLDMTRRLRQLDQFSQTPIIASPATLSQVDCNESFGAGCNSFFPKPIDFDGLLQELAKFLPIEWIYEDGIVTDAIQVISAKSGSDSWVVPPAAELEALHRAAQGGFIQDIQQEAARLKDMAQEYGDFTNRILELAQEFDDEAILHLVEAHI
ncbi:hypothetical protein C7271_06865 [filamentous cyanobacterium CCP5]|nr:hypothetical protein C7271_06865 [filamentous cyanobacterium CCP5]